jgi:hypothetical protein
MKLKPEMYAAMVAVEPHGSDIPSQTQSWQPLMQIRLKFHLKLKYKGVKHGNC